ncbi:uncharacterized protein LOC113757300 [Coffea eugenioides]|uniref:uncharacterized protein LOC113757300 n=1 Tax=Coffea eugenioides TaxID=49369 RepID=UPI000F60862B|nr:uncharacterized protein LOC113757300 [Coffea eugenioides]
MNDKLTKPVDVLEIKAALFSMNPDKAPAIDGMPPNFFQKFWNIIKEDLVKAIQTFSHTGHLVKSVNHTIISLIPKVKNHTSLKQYRPISLCTTVYKIIAKVLANRLKQVLHHCISKNQSAFIPGRQILDNIMLSHEFIHYLNNKRLGKDGFMAVKLDMSKAYDRVEWRFLDAVMNKIGFNDRWRKCMSTVSYSFTINGETREYVSPQRGIRQGDPLSPYLFLLCSKGLSSLLHTATEEKRIRGLKLSRHSPTVSHLFFADDSLIFCKADPNNAMELRRILLVYEKGTGQMINLEKSSVLFSRNVVQQLQLVISQALGDIQIVAKGRYLGLPMVVTRSKHQIFGYIKDNIQHRLQKWKNKLLSAAGKEVMLKAVALALPTYTMSCFKIPKRLCKDINSTMANYWWGEVPANASWIWKGLMGARKFMVEGIRRRIGNGKSTNIWDDYWIPNAHLGKDAEKILKIPISLGYREDCHYWIHGTNGIYTVGSAYRKLTQTKMHHNKKGGMEEASTSWSNQSHGLWTYLWKLKVKHKVKIFLWKCLSQAQPVRHLIASRTKQGDPICRGSEESETIEHVLLRCSYASQVWRLAPIQWDVTLDQQSCFNRWWTMVTAAKARREGNDHLSLTANILWLLWKSRNAREFNAKQRQPWKTVQKAHEEWANSQLGIGITCAGNFQHQCQGWALHERSAGHQLIDGLEAVKLLLSKAAVHQFENIEVQLDNKQVFHLIQNAKTQDMRLTTLLEDILTLKALFQMCSFCLVDGDNNHLSNRISAYALNISQDEEFEIP